MSNILIYISIIVVLLSSLVIFSKNPIHSILALVLLFFFISILFLFLKIEFIAIIMLIIYVGALTVLFLFVVMMLNIRVIELEKNIYSYIPFLIIILGLFFFQLYYIFDFKVSNTLLNFYDYSTVLNNIFIGGDRNFNIYFTNFHENLFKQKFLENDPYLVYDFINHYTHKHVNFITLQEKLRLYDDTIKYCSVKSKKYLLKEDEIHFHRIYFTNRFGNRKFSFVNYESFLFEKFHHNNEIIKTFGSVLYSYYSPYFIILGFILLLAMIGSIALVLEVKQRIVLKEFQN